MNCKIIMATAAILVLVAGTFVVLSDESDAAGIDTSEFAGVTMPRRMTAHGSKRS